MKGLFHVHSNYSFDGKNSLSELVNFCIKRRFDFIALTEHAEDFNESKMQLYVRECENLSKDKVTVLPGLEFGFKEYPGLHLLGVGLKKFIIANDILTTIDEVHSQEGLAVIAHPSRNNHRIPKEIIKKIDGLEIWNASYDSRYLPHHRSLKLYKNLGEEKHSLIAISGLDMHDINSFRELILLVPGGFKDDRDLLLQLKRGHFINMGKFLSFQSKSEIGFLFRGVIFTGRLFLNLVDYFYWKVRGLIGKTIHLLGL